MEFHFLKYITGIADFVLGLAHLPMETMKESTIHTIRRKGMNPIEIIQFKEIFNMLLLYHGLSIYLTDCIYATDCIYTNLLKLP